MLADDRVNYYPASELYVVKYLRDDVEYSLRTDKKSVTVLGLEPETEYTFFLQAMIGSDNAFGPTERVTYRTQTAGTESHK